MNRTFLKVALRVIGMLSGVMGVAGILFGSYLLFCAGQDAKWWALAFSVFSLLFAGYLVYVAYLVWFKLSPLAVRHVCGLIGFYVFGLATKLVRTTHDPTSSWASVAFLGCLIAIYFGYKAVSRWLTR